eukprot:CAMPEP_0172553940 /NCGR_PEP_ID=MMETSP1067-20121228/52469_1 /TAXON_ID=265564 ORGANISM="Thalassiosira punctigera, Strain Tpunct2005C2" /NCGR_SAMPLE_ID=MMETSP1067 /ASSEMBLY_ACC=CAM_ASM_000444 /LENGTH=218 /DNA_ID=CAMNT_0013342217 /DNA_START=42 /DNA_END=695 /DNA_ORIENTATION=+
MPAHSNPRLNLRLRSASQEQFRRPRKLSNLWRHGVDQVDSPAATAASEWTTVVAPPTIDSENDEPQGSKSKLSNIAFGRKLSRSSTPSSAATVVSLSAAAGTADYPVRAAAEAAGMEPRSFDECRGIKRADRGNLPGLEERAITEGTAASSGSDDSRDESREEDLPATMTFEEFREMRRLLDPRPERLRAQMERAKLKQQYAAMDSRERARFAAATEE